MSIQARIQMGDIRSRMEFAALPQPGDVVQFTTLGWTHRGEADQSYTTTVVSVVWDGRHFPDTPVTPTLIVDEPQGMRGDVYQDGQHVASLRSP